MSFANTTTQQIIQTICITDWSGAMFLFATRRLILAASKIRALYAVNNGKRWLMSRWSFSRRAFLAKIDFVSFAFSLFDLNPWNWLVFFTIQPNWFNQLFRRFTAGKWKSFFTFAWRQWKRKTRRRNVEIAKSGRIL